MAGVAHLLQFLGHLAHRQNDDTRAATYFVESLPLFRELGDQAGIAFGLAGLAAVTTAQGHSERAARLFGTAAALLEASGAAQYPLDRAEYDRNMAFLRGDMSAAAFAAAWEAGRALPLDQATAEALHVADETAIHARRSSTPKPDG